MHNYYLILSLTLFVEEVIIIYVKNIKFISNTLSFYNSLPIIYIYINHNINVKISISMNFN